MAFEKKPAQADTVSALTSLDKAFATIEENALNQRRQIREQVEQAAALAEQRRRDNEKYEYDLAMSRQAVKDQQAAEDKVRDEAHVKRTNEVHQRENELCSLLGCTWENSFDGRKVVQAAFAKKVAEVEKAAEGKATGMAKREFEQEKKLDMANNQAALALLNQKNAQLEVQVKTLADQNAKLLQAAETQVSGMKDLAAKGFEAAGAIGTRGMGALETAAQGGLGMSQRGRG